MEEAEVDKIRRLPPGPHGLSPELVARNQRERLVAAMAEVCAEGGYGEATVAKVARQAGVSTASFYRQFKGRRECMLASFEELFERLWREVKRTCEAETEPTAKAQAGIRIAATLLAGDPPTARLLTVEIAAAGTEGVRLQHEAIERMAGSLRGQPTDSVSRFPDAEWAVVAAMVALVGRRAAEGESPAAAELEALLALL